MEKSETKSVSGKHCCNKIYLLFYFSPCLIPGYICTKIDSFPPKLIFFCCLWFLAEVIFLNLQFCSCLVLLCYYRTQTGFFYGMSCDEWEIISVEGQERTLYHTLVLFCMSNMHHLPQASFRSWYFRFVLGFARTGLIFTGLQEGAQPGGGG